MRRSVGAVTIVIIKCDPEGFMTKKNPEGKPPRLG